MKRLFIYLLATFIVAVNVGLYIPKLTAYAQDKAEQRRINQQILDLQLELEDTKSEWEILDESKQELMNTIGSISENQEQLHNRAEEIRKQIDILKGDKNMNDELVNCYQWTGELYNECLDAIIQVGLIQSRQAQ